jgi:hypothetical protein
MRKTIVVCSIVAALAACGHDSGPGSAVTQQQAEDAGASASVAGLVAFAQVQVARADADASEPRPIDRLVPPVSELDEPAAI